jgi:hypothetical protein
MNATNKKCQLHDISQQQKWTFTLNALLDTFLISYLLILFLINKFNLITLEFEPKKYNCIQEVRESNEKKT